MFKSLTTEGLARTTATHPWLTILVWVLILGASLYSASGLGDVLTDEGGGRATYESQRAQQLIDERLRADTPAVPEEFVIVEADSAVAGNTIFDSYIIDLSARFEALDNVVAVRSYLDNTPGLVSADGRTALIPVQMLDASEGTAAPLVSLIAGEDTAGFRVTTVGNGSINGEFNKLAEETLIKGELIGLALALVILVVVFGAVVAAGVPILLALVSIIVAIGASALVGQVFGLSTFVTNVITMIGLAVGIDYALFIVQRFREERGNGLEKIDAIARAGATASRAVFFSALAVMIALSGMLIIPDATFNSFGIGTILVVVAAMVAALTLLPAVLSLLGDRVNWLTLPIIGRRRAPESTGGLWGLVTRAVTARPLVAVVATTALLVGTGAFYFTINLGSAGVTALPDDSPGRHAFEVVVAQFSDGIVTADVVIDAPDTTDPAVQLGIEQLIALLDNDAAFGDVTTRTNDQGNLVLVQAVMKFDQASAEAIAAVKRIRNDYVPSTLSPAVADVYVGGDTAESMDAVALMKQYIPIIFSVVLGFSFLLLMVVFRSIVVPLKAVLMNLLSVGAAYGLIVLVFQHGIGADLFGFQQTPTVEFWIPMFLFTILFGLSMDYHVFLLSRIKEHYDLTGNNSESVAFGLRSTGAMITGAAAIMVAVFGGFALGDLVMFQQMGFGLAVAVILDATLIRSVLVPASMELLGDWNWYFPKSLEWLPRIHIEGVPDETPAPATQTTGQLEQAPSPAPMSS